jgi:hypothetical protein
MLLRADVLRNHEIYGTYGISVLALRGVAFDDLEAGVGALVVCERSVVENPYHEGE